MRSLYDFIVEPLGDTYENEIDIENVKIILNIKIESFKFVNNVAKVIQVPLAFKTKIKKGDLILIHHNVFRTFYELPGRGVHDAEDWISREGYEDGQESYLGYDPDSDNFVMGFDAFEQSYDEYGNADNDGMMDGVIVLLSPEGRALETITAVPGGMYPEGLRAVKKAMPQIIDIRLD